MFNADNPKGPARKFDLQLFAEGEPVEAPVEPEAPAEPAPAEEKSYDSLSDFLQDHAKGEPTETEPQETPVEEKTEEEKAILGKFKTQDDLINAYQEAQRRITEYGNVHAENTRAKAELEQLRGQVHQLQQWAQRAQQPRQTEKTPEEIQKENQDWLDKFYEDPMKALNEVVEGRVRQEVEPIQKEYQMQKAVQHYNQQVQEARQKYPDFDEYAPQMEEIVKQQGKYLSTLPNAVDVVYSMAKAQSVKEPPTPDSLLQDESFRQKILQDETIKNEILKQYAQGVQENKPPVILGEQQGEVPSTPPEQITNTQEAKTASMNLFRRMLGGGSS